MTIRKIGVFFNYPSVLNGGIGEEKGVVLHGAKEVKNLIDFSANMIDVSNPDRCIQCRI